MTASASRAPATSGQTEHSGFAAIAQPRAHDFVVEQIRRQIALGVVAPGASLPPERELMRMFGVGRATIQLAIGQLEAEHLVETRRGRLGGSFVKGPDADAHALDFRVIELRRHSNRILDAVEYREVLEPVATAMAARKAKRREVKTLTELVNKTAEARDDAEFMRWDTAFHLGIAEVTGNKLILETLERIRLDLNPALQLLPDTRVWHELSNHEHRQLVDAIQDKDAEAAHDLMKTHVSHANQSIRSLIKNLSQR